MPNPLKTRIAAMTVAAVAALSPLGAEAKARSICSAAPSDAFFSMFKCGKAVEIGWSGDYAALDRFSRAETVAYVSALVSAMHGEMAPFHLHPDMLIARDPHLPTTLALKMLGDRDVLQDTMNQGLGVLNGVLGGFLKERQRQTARGDLNPAGEIGAMVEGLRNAPGATILWAGKYGQHDFHALAALSQSDPETAVAIYRGLAALAGRL